MVANNENPKPRIDEPNQPIAAFIQEAKDLYVWCKKDSSKLNSVGITNEMIEQLPSLTDACSEALANWNSYKNTSGEFEKQWKNLAREAADFKAELMKSMRYAFRNHPNLQDVLTKISRGTGFADLFQDLEDISVLGRSNKELLQSISFDLTQLELASKKSDELAELWAQAKASKESNPEFKMNRNRTFWELHGLVTEIRKAGQYVFRNNKSRYIGYTSAYWKNRYLRRIRTEKSLKLKNSDTSRDSNS